MQRHNISTSGHRLIKAYLALCLFQVYFLFISEYFLSRHRVKGFLELLRVAKGNLLLVFIDVVTTLPYRYCPFRTTWWKTWLALIFHPKIVQSVRLSNLCFRFALHLNFFFSVAATKIESFSWITDFLCDRI